MEAPPEPSRVTHVLAAPLRYLCCDVCLGSGRHIHYPTMRGCFRCSGTGITEAEDAEP